MQARLGFPLAGRSTPSNAPRSGFVAAALIAAAFIGLLPGALSPIGALIVLALGVGALGLLLARRFTALRRADFPGGAAVETGWTDPAADAAPLRDRDLRWPRAFFYLGALTVAFAESRPAFGLTVSEMFFFASFAGCAFSVLRGHAVATVPTTLALGVGVFAIGGLISSIGADAPGTSAGEVLHGIYVMLLWIWTGTMVLQTRAHLLTAIGFWTFSAALSGIGAIAEAAGVEAFVGRPLEASRANGFAGHPNDLGGFMAVSLVPALLLATWRTPGMRGVGRWLRWLAVGLIGAGLVLSASVAAMLSAFVGVAIWLSSSSVRTPSRAALAGVIVIVIVTVALAGDKVLSPTERLEQVTSSYSATAPDMGSGMGRLEHAKAAWETISDNPIVGTGMDPNGKAVSYLEKGYLQTQQVHGVPVAVWHEAGIFGLIGFLIVIWAIVAAGWRGLIAAPNAEAQVLGWALLAAFVAFTINSLSLPLFFHQYGWLAAVVLVAWCYRREPAEARSPDGLRRQARGGVVPSIVPHSA